MTHTCKSCGAKVMFLLDGGLCKSCFAVSGVKKLGRPVGDVPFDMAAYQKEYSKINPRTEYFREKARQKYGTIKGRFIVENEGKFRYKQGSKSMWTASIENAKIYSSYAMARRVVDRLGIGTVRELK